MEFTVRQSVFQATQSPDCDVQTLMRLKTSRKQQNQLSVRSDAVSPIKNGGIDMIDQYRAFIAGNRTLYYTLLPQVIGNDHVIREAGRQAFHNFEQPDVSAVWP